MREKGTGKPQQDISPVNVPIQGAHASVRTLELTPGEVFPPHFRQFPVIAGAPYSLDTSTALTAAAESAGYAGLIMFVRHASGNWFESHSSSRFEGKPSSTVELRKNTRLGSASLVFLLWRN